MIKIKFPDELAENIKSGEIGVIPTDTMYGVVASALNPKSVEEVFKLRQRDTKKPFIILISKIEDINIFIPDLSSDIKSILEKIWPEKVSVELPVSDNLFPYLTRGQGKSAFRLPNDPELQKLIGASGPLIAPSANPEGEKPAETLDEAWEYFPELDFYFDDGTYPNSPSTLIRLENGKAVVLRQGAWHTPEFLR